MSKPADISDEAWEQATQITNEFKYDDALQNHADIKELGIAAWHDVEVIARALTAAKLEAYQEAAKVAEMDQRSNLAKEYGYKPDWYIISQRTAAAIRALGDAK